jgi:archaellin
MESYLNRNSGVESFDIGDDYIKVKFKNTQKIYTYSYEQAGINHVEKMKKLARSGNGLNRYINKHIKDI